MPGSTREAQLALSNAAHRYCIGKDGDGAAAVNLKRAAIMCLADSRGRANQRQRLLSSHYLFPLLRLLAILVALLSCLSPSSRLLVGIAYLVRTQRLRPKVGNELLAKSDPPSAATRIYSRLEILRVHIKPVVSVTFGLLSSLKFERSARRFWVLPAIVWLSTFLLVCC